MKATGIVRKVDEFGCFVILCGSRDEFVILKGKNVCQDCINGL